MKLKILTFILVLLGISIYIVPNIITNKSNENNKNLSSEVIKYQEIKENNEKKEVIINESSNEPITNNEQSNNKTSGSSSNPASDTNKDDKKSNTNINSNVVKENKVEYDSTQVENNSTQVENNSTQEVEKENPWDDLEITEYEYFNKPMWSWARVDYSIKDYVTQELTQKACIDAGNNMLENILSFSCTSINSYSGDYLGEMLRVKY